MKKKLKTDKRPSQRVQAGRVRSASTAAPLGEHEFIRKPIVAVIYGRSLAFNHYHVIIFALWFLLFTSCAPEQLHTVTMLLSHGGNAAYVTHHDPQGNSLASHTAELSFSISRAQVLMRDGRHVDAASILSQHGRRQHMAVADAARRVQMLIECAQFCAGRSQDTMLLGIQMCHDAQTVAESAGLPPQQLLPVLLVHPPSAPPLLHVA